MTEYNKLYKPIVITHALASQRPRGLFPMCCTIYDSNPQPNIMFVFNACHISTIPYLYMPLIRLQQVIVQLKGLFYHHRRSSQLADPHDEESCMHGASQLCVINTRTAHLECVAPRNQTWRYCNYGRLCDCESYLVRKATTCSRRCTCSLVLSVQNFVYRCRRGGKPTCYLPATLNLICGKHGAAGEDLDRGQQGTWGREARGMSACGLHKFFPADDELLPVRFLYSHRRLCSVF